MDVIAVERYGKIVQENVDMENFRKDECLCHACEKMNPGSQNHCKIATKFYEICKEYGNAFILTRCESFIPAQN